MAKEEILIDLKIDAEESNESINSLRASVREMTKARNEANLSTAEGRATVQSLNQAIDANNAKIKSNIDSLTKQRMNVGNYKKDIQDAIPALDKFTGGAVSAGQGILTMTKQALTFIATPIGAILATVAATLALVTAALKRSEPALDFFDDVIGSITEGARFLVDNLAAIGSVLGNVFTGNMAEAAATTGKLAEEFKNAQRESQRLREEFRELEDEEAKLIAATAGTEAQIKALIIQSKNRTLTEKERIALLKQAEELERTSTEQKVAFENRKSAATIQQIGTERDLRQAQGETIDAYVQRLIASEKLSGEEKKAVAEAYAARVNASTATLALQEKIQNAQDAAYAKEEEAAKASSERKIAIAKAEADAKIAILYEEKGLRDALAAINLAQEQAERERILQANTEFKEEQELDSDEVTEYLIQNEDRLAELRKKNQEKVAQDARNAQVTDQMKLASASNLTAGLSQLLGKQSAEGKAAAIVSIGTNSAAGISAAVKAGAGLTFPANLVAIASGISAVLAGILQAKSVLGFAKGGLLKMYNNGGLLNGPSHANGGIPFSVGGRVGFEAEGGEAIINKRSTALFRPMLSAINRAGGGVAFEDGGVLGFPSSTISGGTNSFFDLSRLEQTISNLKVQVAVTDINDGQKNYAEITDRAQF
jgi:hypothetical protein